MTDTFLLTNKIGGYALLSPSPNSKYEGVFFFQKDKMFKFIDQIRCSEPQTGITYNHWSVQRFHEDFSERIAMPHSYDSLIWQADKEASFDLILDPKESYDDRAWGRNFEFSEEKGCIVITFIKRTDHREDGSDGDEEYRMHLAIAGHISSDKNDSWEEVDYSYDRFREAPPYSRYVFNALKLTGKKIVFSCSPDKKKAIREANYVNTNLGRILKKQHAHTDHLIETAKLPIPDEEQRDAYESSVIAMDNLTAVHFGMEGLFAGLPWFFQFWTRDEAISLKSLLISGQTKKAENIILRQISTIRPDGRIQNRFPDSDLGSADGVGWVFKRTADLIDQIEKMHAIRQFLTRRTRRRILDALEKSIYFIAKYYKRDGLIFNHAKETWMDTDYGEDTREGNRIEIQALHLSMLRLMHRLSRNQKYLGREIKFRQSVLDSFMEGGILLDGPGDNTSRPNIFIACYLYQDLLAPKVWEEIFDKILPLIYQEWGGVSSIGKDSALYCPKHFAKQDRSYHRGDSWYWVNNLVAIVLNRINPERYDKEIQAIVSASAKEIETMGVKGYHAELSPAEEQGSVGCLAQAWSSALYIELMHELYS